MSHTELDDLKSTWQMLNRNLERQHAFALSQFKDDKAGRLRAGFRWLLRGQILQIICGAFLALLGGGFWVDHLGTAHLMISGIFLHLYGLMFIVFAARDLYLIQRLDYSAPVLDLQKKLAALRAWHLRAAAWYGFTGSVVWLPVMIMLLHSLGAELWIDNLHTLLWLVLTAIVCLALNWGLMRLARSPGKCGLLQRRSFIGHTDNRAQTTLDEIAEFEEE
ncbi:MAG: hypothetical protein M3R10_05520 [Verrucomicrobiota bacterium]|nr:hypothetical protein [Verrucomicrobiota bacterium]